LSYADDTRRPSRRGTTSRPVIVTRLVALGMPAVAGLGVARAVRPERTARPRPTVTLAGAVIGVAAVSAALTIGVNLDHLVQEPRLQGWHWDVLIGYGGEDQPEVDQALRELAGDATVAELASYRTADSVTARGEPVPAVVVANRRGALTDRMVPTKRGPTAPDEVVLGYRTADRLGVSVGQKVRLTGPKGSEWFKVVGETVLWTGLGESSMGTGAMLTPAGLDRLAPAEKPRQVIVLFKPGVATGPAARALEDRYGDVVRYYPVEEVQNLKRVRVVPYAVAGLLGMLGLLGVALSLVSSVRDGQNELAVLKALGFVRRQVYEIVTWQAMTHGVLAIAIGVPVGVVLGRWGWLGLARALEAAAEPVSPGGVLVVGIALTLLAVLVVAALPGLLAAAVRPSPTLRAE
jgi:putative ABC transport system permease protein